MVCPEEPGPAFGSHTNRRDLPSPAVRRCRVCWEAISVSRDSVEEGERYPFFRCPHCGSAFPIRREDVTDRAPTVASS